MEIINYAKMDVAKRTVPFVIDAVQGEINSRTIKVSLFENGVAWDFGGSLAEIRCSLAFEKPDRTSGWYDKMPNGSIAYEFDQNVLSMKIAPQVLSAYGEVKAVIRMEWSETNRATTFPFVINVAEDPAINAPKSENYYNVQNWDQVNSQIGELTDELVNRPTYYGSVDPAQYGYLISKLVEPGYYGVDSTWKDVPANSSFAIRVYKYTKNYVIQIAQDIRSSASFIRVVKINDNSIYTDWTSSTDNCLEYRQIPPEIIAEKLCSKIVKTGAYGVNSNMLTDIPNGTYTLMVYQYTPNWVMQILVGVYSGITYNRIVNKGTTEVLRDWLDNECRDPISILCVGDSISYGARNGGKGFVGDLGYKYLNAAVSGATISNAREDKTNIPDQLVSTENYEPTVIIAEGGINDYLMHVPLGEIPETIVTKDADASLLDRNTVIGAVHFLVYNMVKLYPKAQKFFLFIHKTVYYNSNNPNGVDCTNTKNSAGYTQTELFDAIRKVCALYNIKIIDVFNKSVINTAFDQYRSTIPYSEDNSVTDREFVDHDGLHPLAYGYLHGYVPIVKQALQGGGDVGSAVGGGKDGYTPVKGKDYYTEADKAEMVEDVIAALPKYNGEVEAV